VICVLGAIADAVGWNWETCGRGGPCGYGPGAVATLDCGYFGECEAVAGDIGE
jgi:hypothetical protein